MEPVKEQALQQISKGIEKIDDSSYKKTVTTEETIPIIKNVMTLAYLIKQRDVITARIDKEQAEIDEAVSKGVKIPTLEASFLIIEEVNGE